MRSKKALVSAIYGALLIIASFIAYWASPAVAKTAFQFGTVCGALSIAWGILGLLRRPFVPLAGLTIGLMGFILLSQVILGWLHGGANAGNPIAANSVMTVMFAGTFGVLIYILYPADSPAGVQQPAQSAAQPAPRPQKPARFAADFEPGPSLTRPSQPTPTISRKGG